MECREFSYCTKDFIYGKITDYKLISRYLEHADSCKDCKEELEIIYSMHRALGDIVGPYGDDDSSDYILELEQIINSYNSLMEYNIRIRRIRILAFIIFEIAVVVLVLYFFTV